MLLAVGFSGFMVFRFVQKTRESLGAVTSIGGTGGLAAASKPIPVSETTLTRETVRERAREFRLRQYLGGYRKHGRHDVPWDDDAAKLIEAWKARGSGWANTVTPEGWKGFEDHLAKARAALTQAWKLHPQRPLAPCCMVTVAMGDSDANETRIWFDRAIEGQIDLQTA
ncbi:MAG: hypothetical protein QHJ82_04360 [Verrucomicrobiota bacterium]|nr:hypothetical protein [Verrucomicrobiota bacterium]